MPVKSKHMHEDHDACACSTSVGMNFSSYGAKIVFTLLSILIIYCVVFLGTLIRNNMEKFYTIGKADRVERTISVEAQGKVTVRPDVAVTSMGMVSEATTVADAQKKNTDVMNKLIEKLKGMGIESKDIQTTSYNVYPQYVYKEGDQSLKGYQVSQTVTVKIRNLDNANKVLALAGEVGANNVSGLSFTVDDRDKFRTEARDIALQKVHEKAAALSKQLGVRVGSIVNFSEYEGTGISGGDYGAANKAYDGMGGAAPSLEAGNTEIIMNVSVVYELRS